MNELNREIATVNLPPLANPDFNVQNQEPPVEKKGVEGAGTTATATPNLTISTTPVSTGAAPKVSISELEAPAVEAGSPSQLQRLLHRLQQDSRNIQFRLGMDMVDANRNAAVACNIAAMGLLSDIDNTVRRGNATVVAIEAISALGKMAMAEDPESVDLSALSPEAAKLVELYSAQIANHQVTPGEIAEQVLQQAWDNAGVSYTAEELASAGKVMVGALKTSSQMAQEATQESRDAAAGAQDELEARQSQATASAAAAEGASQAAADAAIVATVAQGAYNLAQEELAAAQEELAGLDDTATPEEVAAAQTAVDNAQNTCNDALQQLIDAQRQADQRYQEALAAAAQAGEDAIAAAQAATSAADAAAAYDAAVQLALQAFASMVENICQALADYTQAVAERNNALKEQNDRQAVVDEELNKELLRLCRNNEDLAERLGRALAAAAAGIAAFQQHLAGVVDAALETEKAQSAERMV